VRQTEQGAVILQRVVGAPHHPEGVAAAIADQAHGQAVRADVVADLFEGPRVDERGDAVDPWGETRIGEARGDADHVLLGDAGVDEARPHRLAQRLKGLEAEIPSQEDEVRVGGVRD
jgi:hypothetical protein